MLFIFVFAILQCYFCSLLVTFWEMAHLSALLYVMVSCIFDTFPGSCLVLDCVDSTSLAFYLLSSTCLNLFLSQILDCHFLPYFLQIHFLKNLLTILVTVIYRGSYISAHVLLNLLNELRKRDKMRGLPSILSLFCNEFNKFNNTRARMLDSIYHMTLSHFCRKTF